jgi:hypothetical protein
MSTVGESRDQDVSGPDGQGRPSAWWCWWWLLPLVMYVLHRRWTTAFRQATFAQLTLPSLRPPLTQLD